MYDEITDVLIPIANEVMDSDEFDVERYEEYLDDTDFDEFIADTIVNKYGHSGLDSIHNLYDYDLESCIRGVKEIIETEAVKKIDKEDEKENMKKLKKDKAEYRLDFLDLLVGRGLIEIKGDYNEIRKEFYKNVVKSKDFQTKDEFLNFLSTLIDIFGKQFTLNDINDIIGRLKYLKRKKERKKKKPKNDKKTKKKNVMDLYEEVSRRLHDTNNPYNVEYSP